MSNLLFPSLPGLDISVKRTPVYATKIQTASSGKEQRASFQSFPRYRYELRMNFLRQVGNYNALVDEAGTLGAFFMQHRGSWDSFLFADPYDSSDTAMGFGVGNGATTVFQLQRREPGTYTTVLGTFAFPTTPRTNLCTFAQTFSGGWTTNNTVHTNNVAVAPDGSITAGRINDNATNGQHFETMAVTGLSIGQTYTASAYLKAGSLRFCYLQLASSFVNVDLSAGVVDPLSSPTTTYQIASLGNGWFRISIQRVAAATSENLLIGCYVTSGTFNYAGAGSYLYAWGAQVELGTTSTEPISTSGAAVTATPGYYPGTDGFEPVTEPAPGIVISKAGVALVQGTDWTLGASGLVTMAAAPASGASLTWTGGYYRRCRFDSDEEELERMLAGAFDGKTIKLISVK